MLASDYIQIAVIASSAIGFGAMVLNRYAVANHNDRLARLTAGTVNAAGRINKDLTALPPGSNLAAVEAALMSKEVPALMEEFSETVAKMGANPGTVAGMVKGALGQLPAPTAAALSGAVTTLEASPAVSASAADMVTAAVQTIASVRAAVGSLDALPSLSASVVPSPPAADAAVVPVPAPAAA